MCGHQQYLQKNFYSPMPFGIYRKAFYELLCNALAGAVSMLNRLPLYWLDDVRSNGNGVFSVITSVE